MCNFCKFDQNGLAVDDFTNTKDMGFLGDFVVVCGLDSDNCLSVWTAIDNNPVQESDDEDNMVSAVVLREKIKYCPMCGRKLERGVKEDV